MGVAVTICQRPRRVCDSLFQFCWLDHPRVPSPTQNPPLDFFQISQCQREVNAAISQQLDLLRRMPLPLLYERGGECVECNMNRVLRFCRLGKNPKALLEISADGKIHRSPKPCFTHADVAN